MWTTVLILFGAASLVGFFLYQKNKYVFRPDIAPKPYTDLPNVGKDHFFFGYLAQTDFEKGYHHDFYQFSLKHGFFSLFVGPPGLSVVACNDPEILQQVMPSLLKKSAAYDAVEPLLGTGLLRAYGDLWKRQRKLIEPAFHLDNLKYSANVTTSKLEKLISIWETNNFNKSTGTIDIEIRKEIQKLTLDVVGLIGFGHDFNAIEEMEEEGSLANNFDTYLTLLEKRVWAISRVQYWLPTKQNQTFRKSKKILDEFLEKTVQKRITSDSKTPDILYGMIKQVSESKAPLDLDQMRYEAANFLFAGHDTTATAVAFTLYLLAIHPEIQQQTFEDVSKAVPDGDFTYESVAKMDLLDRVWKESLRLFPPAHALGRRTETDVNIGGYHVPPNMDLGISPWIVHRHPKHWPEPEKFDPDRFLPENSKDRHPFAYIPFFLPPRNCIGMRLAQVEGKLALAMLLHKYSVAMKPGAPAVETASALTLKPKNGIWLSLSKRK